MFSSSFTMKLSNSKQHCVIQLQFTANEIKTKINAKTTDAHSLCIILLM